MFVEFRAAPPSFLYQDFKLNRSTRTHFATPTLVSQEVIIMLKWAIIFIIVALVAAILGFSGIAGVASDIAIVLFVVFLVLALIAFVRGRA
jgi:uncharacterized membrane protein YtjA (UPF0391 family)